jgi:hypothetical protein
MIQSALRRRKGRWPLSFVAGAFVLCLFTAWSFYFMSVFHTSGLSSSVDGSSLGSGSQRSSGRDLRPPLSQGGGSDTSARLTAQAKRLLDLVNQDSASSTEATAAEVIALARSIAGSVLENGAGQVQAQSQAHDGGEQGASGAGAGAGASAPGGAAAGTVAKGSSAARGPAAILAEDTADWDPSSYLYSHQTTYLGSDENEMSVYDNALCFNGRNPIVTVEDPVEIEEINDYSHACE